MRGRVTGMLVVFSIIFMMGGEVTYAASNWKEESYLLPNYCRDRATGSEAWTKWKRTFGGVYIHMHHYCSGVYAEIKARSAAETRVRESWLNEVVHQMNYVGRSCDLDCVVYSELHTRWGWALGEQGKIRDAVKHFDLAIRGQPSNTTSYALLADLYVKQGRPQDARKVVEAGLEVRPTSKKLQRRLRELTGSDAT